VSIYAVNGKEPIAAWIPSLDSAGNGTTTLTDLVGSNNGTLTNMDAATDWVADTNAGGVRALDFDGTNDEVLFPSAFSTMPFSVSLWAKSRVNNVNQSIFGLGSSTTIQQFFVVSFRGDLSGDPITAHMRGSSGLSTSFATGSGFVVNQWHHVVATFSSTTYRQVFVDSIAGTANTDLHTVEPINRMSLGSLPRTTSIVFANALIDDVRLFDQELDASDIQYLYAGGLGRGIGPRTGIIPILRQHYAAQGAR